MSAYDRRLDRISEQLPHRLTSEEVEQATRELKADPNTEFVLGMPIAHLKALIDAEITRLEAEIGTLA